MNTHSADLGALLDRPLGRWRLIVFLLCGLVMAIEGFDMYMIGSIVPALAAGIGVSPPAIAAVFVAQGLGLALGYVTISPFADRFGRRPIIILCVAAFGLITLLTTQATSLTQVSALRFCAFVFFGGVVPNTISLVSEIVAFGERAKYVVLLNACFALGAASGSALAPLLGTWLGWQGAFWAGGIAPLAMLPLLVLLLPESPRFLVIKGRPAEAVRLVMRRIAPEAAGVETFTTLEQPASRVPVAALFSGGRTRNTLLFTLAGGMMMLVGNLVASWAPTYWHMMAGFPMQKAAGLFAVSSVGAIFWPFAMILLIGRIGLKYMLVLCYGLGTISMLVFAIEPATALLAMLVAVGYGAFVAGAISGLYALVASAYPTNMRATALGWTSGLGRLLSVAGPAIGGFMLANQYSQLAIALVFAVPLAIAGVAVAAVRLAPLASDAGAVSAASA